MDVTQQLMTTENSTIKLDQFLKFVGAAQTGGEAKLMIQDGEVTVNEVTEIRRGRKLIAGDQVTVRGETYVVELG
jgi:ribosome-associated protein